MEFPDHPEDFCMLWADGLEVFLVGRTGVPLLHLPNDGCFLGDQELDFPPESPALSGAADD